MVKFVRLATPGGGWIPINPDAVQYLRVVKGQTMVVFGGLVGGLHEVIVEGDVEDLLALLEGRAPAKPETPPARRPRSS